MMPRILKWVFRPAVLIGVSIALVGTGAVIVFQPESGQGKPQPAAVRPGEQEIAFLYPATSSTWERFVKGAEHAQDSLQRVYPGLEIIKPGKEPAPAQTVPEVALRWPGRQGQLVFRWYKLTSEWTTAAWVEALLARKPAPLAIIGGNNSYWARELALQLARVGANLPEDERPLLLLTTATADQVPPGRANQGADTSPDMPLSRWGEEDREGKMSPDSPRPVRVPLAGLYPNRTFRFCFTNRQMATAITRFIWSRPELRPDSDPAYVVKWTDDAYSQDLYDGYAAESKVLDRRAAESIVYSRLQWWASVSGATALGGIPAPCLFAGLYTPAFAHNGNEQLLIDSSVGSFTSPNPYEAKVAQELVAKANEDNAPRRPLLVVTGQAQPSRRFLRDVARSAPDTARRFVVALGDTVSFNVIYRDRMVAWPIEDLPFATVFFCHRNPIDEKAGFRPRNPRDRENRGLSLEASTTSEASGTEDLLLFADIVEALVLAFHKDGRPDKNARQLADGLRSVHLRGDRLTLTPEGVRLFGRDGQRNGSTGENVVYLRPTFQGDRVLPESTIEVWYRQTSNGSRNVWLPHGLPLTVSYDEYKVHGDRSHGGD